MQTRDQAILDAIAAYNREDCIATRVLRDWLLERRAEALARVRAVPAARAGGVEGDAAREGRAGGAARGAARRRATSSPPSSSTTTTASASPSGGRSSTGSSRARRSWSRIAEAIALLEPVGEPEQDKRSFVYRLAYPAQEHKLDVGHQPFDEDGAPRGRDRRARPRGSRARAQARAVARRTSSCRWRSCPASRTEPTRRRTR